MRLRWMLLSFRGRIGRSQYWLARIILSAVFVTLIVVAVDMSDWVNEKKGFFPYLLALVVFADVLVAWSGLALDVKRLHDLGLSAWWFTLGLIPVLGLVLLPLLFYLARGSDGDNRYGPDRVPSEPVPASIGVSPRPHRKLIDALF